MKRQPVIKKAQAPFQLATYSVGNDKTHDAYKLHPTQLLQEFDLATTQLEIAENEVEIL